MILWLPMCSSSDSVLSMRAWRFGSATIDVEQRARARDEVGVVGGEARERAVEPRRSRCAFGVLEHGLEDSPDCLGPGLLVYTAGKGGSMLRHAWFIAARRRSAARGAAVGPAGRYLGIHREAAGLRRLVGSDASAAGRAAAASRRRSRRSTPRSSRSFRRPRSAARSRTAPRRTACRTACRRS